MDERFQKVEDLEKLIINPNSEYSDKLNELIEEHNANVAQITTSSMVLYMFAELVRANIINPEDYNQFMNVVIKDGNYDNAIKRYDALKSFIECIETYR